MLLWTERRSFDVETRPFDPAEYLDSEEAIEAYLADARAGGVEERDDAIEIVTRARAARDAFSRTPIQMTGSFKVLP